LSNRRASALDPHEMRRTLQLETTQKSQRIRAGDEIVGSSTALQQFCRIARIVSFSCSNRVRRSHPETRKVASSEGAHNNFVGCRDRGASRSFRARRSVLQAEFCASPRSTSAMSHYGGGAAFINHSIAALTRSGSSRRDGYTANRSRPSRSPSSQSSSNAPSTRCSMARGACVGVLSPRTSRSRPKGGEERRVPASHPVLLRGGSWSCPHRPVLGPSGLPAFGAPTVQCSALRACPLLVPPPCSARPFGPARFLPPPNSVLGRSGLRAEWGRPSLRRRVTVTSLKPYSRAGPLDAPARRCLHSAARLDEPFK
jgi:hypothetical protein